MRTFRWTAVGTLLLAAASFLGLPGCDPNPAGLELNHPPLAVDPPSLRLPRIPFGKGAAGQFLLRNEGSEPLTITGIGPTGCDCAVADLLLPGRPPGEDRVRVQDRGMRVSLAPGEEAVLELTLSTLRSRQPTRFKASAIPLYVEGYDYLALEYSADIWVPFWAEPWAVQLGTVGIRERKPGLVSVRALEEEEFEILAPDQIDGWELEVEQVSLHPSAYNIHVTPPPELPAGSFLQEFELNTSLPEMPVRFSVIGMAVADLAYSPQRLLLRPDEGVTAATASLRMLPSDRLLRVLEARAETEEGLALPVEVEPVEPGRSYRVEVSLPADGAGGAKRATLTILTDDADQPEVQIPVQILRLPAR